MGYDLYLAEVPTDYATRIREAGELLERTRGLRVRPWPTGSDRDPQADGHWHQAVDRVVEAASHLFEEAQSFSYFRLSILDMRVYRQAMTEFGMVYDADLPTGWPEPPNDRVAEVVAALDAGEDPATAYINPTPGEIDDAHAYVRQTQAFRAAHPDGGEVIPTHKLTSTGGWLVTPEEIRAALKRHDAHPDRDAVLAACDIPPSEWTPWIEYLARAARFGGCHVW